MGTRTVIARRLRSETGVRPSIGSPWPIWVTSAIFSLLVITGYRFLEEREFLPVVGALALIHLLTVIARAPRLSWHLFVSQTLVVAATLASVMLHVAHIVGPAPPGLSRTLSSFIQASITSPSTYLYFARNLMAFCVVLAAVLLATRASRLRPAVDAEVVLVAAYTMSSVNIAFDYSLTRPLTTVSGDPDALTFFFTAGLFGVEFSLPLHLLLLTVCLVWHHLVYRPPQVPGRRRRSRVSDGRPSSPWQESDHDESGSHASLNGHVWEPRTKGK